MGMGEALKTVLVVDDDKSLADALCVELRSIGLSVVCVNSGKEGFSNTLSHKPSLIVLDILMPDLDGLKLLKKLRLHKNEYCQKVPVLVLTNLTSGPALEEAKRLGCIDYLIKSDTSLSRISSIVKQKISN